MARASGMPLGDTKASGFSRESAHDGHVAALLCPSYGAGSAIQRILQS